MNQIKFPEEDNDDIPIVCPSTFPFVIMKKYSEYPSGFSWSLADLIGVLRLILGIQCGLLNLHLNSTIESAA